MVNIFFKYQIKCAIKVQDLLLDNYKEWRYLKEKSEMHLLL